MKSYRPSAPLVINLIALFIVLGGQALAISGGKVQKDDLAPGAVTAFNLAKGSVRSSKLSSQTVRGADLAKAAVIGRTLARNSVNGQALQGTIEQPVTIPDADPNGDPGEFNWTTSGAAATCPAGTLRLNGGVRIEDSATHRAFLQSTFPSATNGNGWVGEISTNTGGASPGLLLALCLR